MPAVKSRPRLDLACRLTPDVLLVLGPGTANATPPLTVTLVAGGVSTPCAVDTVRGTQESAHGRASNTIDVHIVRLPAPLPATETAAELHLADASGEPGPLVRLSDAGGDVRDAARRMATLDAASRREVLGLCAAAAASGAARDTGGPSARANLMLLREALRDRAPLFWAQDDPAGRTAPPSLFMLDQRGFYLCGALPDMDAPPRAVALWTPAGLRVDLTAGLQYRVHGAGMHVRGGFTLDAQDRATAGWLLHVTSQSGRTVELRLADVEPDSPRVADDILADLGPFAGWDDATLRDHVAPALRRWRAARAAAATAAHIEQLGPAPLASDVSVIVPLYRRLDLLEHQLVQFSNDPAFRRVDLIYIVEPSRTAPDPLPYARQLQQLHGLPFRMLVLSHSAGMAVAMNAGFARARSGHVILMHSDTMPALAGWTTELRRLYDSLRRPGLLGPKLLRADGRVDQAGLAFESRQVPYRQHPVPRFAGRMREAASVGVQRGVAAVSAACLMTSEHVYASLGGMDPLLLDGGWEDVDLSLSAAQHGYERWYTPRVELYHLGAQSRRRTSDAAEVFNAWLLTRKWAAPTSPGRPFARDRSGAQIPRTMSSSL